MSVLYGCRFVKRESTVVVGQFEISHATRGIFFQKEKRLIPSTWSVNFLLFSSLYLWTNVRNSQPPHGAML